MHKLIALVFLMVGGCATVPPPATPAGEPAVLSPSTSDNVPVHGATPGRTCNASAGQTFIGQPANADTEAAILRATNAAVLRWAPPGIMLTMDYRADRITVWLDPANKITKLRCG